MKSYMTVVIYPLSTNINDTVTKTNLLKNQILYDV